MLTLTPNPTFKLFVDIHVPGGKKEKIEFEFRYKDRDEYKDFLARHAAVGSTNDEPALEIVVGWSNGDLPFTEENLRKIFQKYQTAAYSIVAAYCADLEGRKLSN